jgi:hypothetical protein
VAKTVPICKGKGGKNNVENDRPIANFCTSSKIFEKLVLKIDSLLLLYSEHLKTGLFLSSVFKGIGII